MLRPMLMDNKISENITECVPVLVKHSRPTKLSGFGSHPQLRIILISSLTGIRKIILGHQLLLQYVNLNISILL